MKGSDISRAIHHVPSSAKCLVCVIGALSSLQPKEVSTANAISPHFTDEQTEIKGEMTRTNPQGANVTAKPAGLWATSFSCRATYPEKHNWKEQKSSYLIFRLSVILYIQPFTYKNLLNLHSPWAARVSNVSSHFRWRIVISEKNFQIYISDLFQLNTLLSNVLCLRCSV